MAAQNASERRRESATPESVLEVLQETRESLQEIFAATGVDTTQTRATARTLDLDRMFVWRLSRALSSPDILDTAKDFPDLSRAERICQACLDHGATPGQAARLRRAAARLDDLILDCAGSRESFTVMLSGLEYDDVTQRQEKVRKQAFQGNSAVWGVQARLLIKALIVFPCRSDPEWLTVCRVAGMIDFRRLRVTDWPLHRSVSYNDDGTPLLSRSEAIDAQAMATFSLPLFAQFCTDPLPEITRTTTSYGEQFDLAASAIGNASSVDCIFADVIPCAHLIRRTETNRYIASMVDVTTPAKSLVSDLYLHRDLAVSGEPEALLLDRVNSSPGDLPEADDRHRLPLSSKPLLLGPGSGGVATPNYPRYPHLVAELFDRLGVLRREFTGYRLLLEYPPMSTAVIVRSWLPDIPRKE